MEEIIEVKYKASDGTIFSTKESCLKYEEHQEHRRLYPITKEQFKENIHTITKEEFVAEFDDTGSQKICDFLHSRLPLIQFYFDADDSDRLYGIYEWSDLDLTRGVFWLNFGYCIKLDLLF